MIVRNSHSLILPLVAILVTAALGCSRNQEQAPIWPADEKDVLKQAKLALLEKGQTKIGDAVRAISEQGRDVNPAIAPEASQDTSSLTGWAWASGSAGPAAAPGTMPAECEKASDPLACWGDQIRNAKGCIACHSVDGVEQQPAPNWKDLFGHQVMLESGETVVADEAYVRNSIGDPWSQVVQGYGRTMPPQNLTSTEIDAMIGYLKSISSAGGAKKTKKGRKP